MLKVPAIFTAIDNISKTMQKMTLSVSSFADKSIVSMSRLERRTRAVGKSAETSFQYLTGGKAGYAIAAGVGLATYAFKEFVSEASKIEDAVANFTPILGGAEKAEKLVQKLNIAAAETPFEFEDITNSVQKLLPIMNGDLDKTVNTFKMLGDTAGGNVQKLDSITRGYSKAALKTKVDMESLNMIAEAGVPIFPEMAKSMGFAENQMGEFFKKISTGKVPFSELEKAIQTMTSKGGMFFKGMEISSKTFSGRMSTLRDTVKMAFAEIGQEALPYLKDFAIQLTQVAENAKLWVKENKNLIGQKLKSFFSGIVKVVSFLIKNYKTILFFTKLYIGTLIVLKTISIASAIATNGIALALGIYNVAIGVAGALTGTANIAIGQSVIAMRAYRIASFLATSAQWLFNAAMTANPIGLVIVGIAALIGYLYIAINHWNEFGAVMVWLLGPIGILLNVFMAIKSNWDAISTAFTEGRIIDGILLIGQSIFDAILYPIQQAFELLNKFTGVGSGVASKIEGFRQNQLGSKQGLEKINNDVERNNSLKETITRQQQNVSIDINDKNNNSAVSTNNNFIPIKLNSTLVR